MFWRKVDKNEKKKGIAIPQGFALGVPIQVGKLPSMGVLLD
jgi:hypothetical protein